MTTIFLVARDGDAQGQTILGELAHGDVLGDTAGVRHPRTAEEARADVATWLDAIHHDWRQYLEGLSPRARALTPCRYLTASGSNPGAGSNASVSGSTSLARARSNSRQPGSPPEADGPAI